MKEFFFGFIYPLKSFRIFFKNPKLIIYTIVPFIINIIIYGTFFIFTYKWLIGNSEKVTGADAINASWWQELLNVLLLTVLFLLVLLICYLTFITIGNLITAPLNEIISRQAEVIFTKKEIEYNVGLWKDAFLSVKAEGLKVTFYLSILIPIFLLNLIPVIGSVLSTSLGILFSFFYNALDFLDYPMTRKFFTLRNKIKVVLSRKMLSLGFGCCVFLMMFLPLINIFLKPVCVVAGTTLFFEKNYFAEN